ncbi:RNA-binding protein, partial [Pseudoalteromonas sp. S979]
MERSGSTVDGRAVVSRGRQEINKRGGGWGVGGGGGVG